MYGEGTLSLLSEIKKGKKRQERTTGAKLYGLSFKKKKFKWCQKKSQSFDYHHDFLSSFMKYMTCTYLYKDTYCNFVDSIFREVIVLVKLVTQYNKKTNQIRSDIGITQDEHLFSISFLKGYVKIFNLDFIFSASDA